MLLVEIGSSRFAALGCVFRRSRPAIPIPSPPNSTRVVCPGKTRTVARLLKEPPPPGARTHSFASVYRQGRYAHVIEPGEAPLDDLKAFCCMNHGDACHVGLVTRDYGMFERREAPPAIF